MIVNVLRMDLFAFITMWFVQTMHKALQKVQILIRLGAVLDRWVCANNAGHIYLDWK